MNNIGFLIPIILIFIYGVIFGLAWGKRSNFVSWKKGFDTGYALAKKHYTEQP